MFNLSERRGHNKTVVAVANKLARVVFAVLRSVDDYEESKFVAKECVATELL